VNAHEAIHFEDAVARIEAACERLESETIALEDAAGRILARTLVADDDLVPFARSAMDGFAIAAADARERRSFPVRGRAYAERAPSRRHEPGTATAIATGAPIPLGADAVVPIEDVVEGDGTIVLDRLHAVRAGDHVFPPGEDARRGDVLAREGEALRPQILALLASAGHATLDVIRRPRASVVTSGEEIVAVSARPAFGEIRNSNATAVAAALAAFGAEIVGIEHVRDDRDALRRTIARAAERSDLVVTTGGASVGERDFVKPALDDLGATFAFRSVAMRPARPSAFARLGASRIVALPGNPAAVSVALAELVRVAIARLAGRSDARLPRFAARVRGEIHGKGDRTYFAFVALGIDADGVLEATPLENQCSALTRTSADASGFAVVPPDRGDVRNGDRVAVDVFDWSLVRSPVRV
jgi:molybdopterin molybdotransferase